MIYTEEQKLFRQTIREFARNELAPATPQILETGMVPPELFKRAGELGILGVVCPEDLPGGTGLGFIEMCIAYDELCQVCPGFGLSVEVNIHSYGILRKSQALLDKYMAKINAGDLRLGACFTPPEGQPNVAEHKVTYKKVEGGYIANGTRLYASNGDAPLVDLQGLDEDGNSVIGFIESDWEGVEALPLDDKLGLAGNHGCTVIFKDVFVPEENVCPMAVDSHEEMYWSVYSGCPAEALGCAKGLFEKTVDFCKTRTRSGKPVTQTSGISYRLADIYSKIIMCEEMIYGLAAMQNEYRRTGDDEVFDSMLKVATATKIRTSEMLMEVSKECVKLNGGLGFHDPNIWHYLGDQLDYPIMDIVNENHLQFLAGYMGLFD